MKLGTIEVDEYVGKAIDVEPDRGRKAMLAQMRDNPYGNEKDVLQHFEFLEFASTTNTREIDLSFLSMSKDFKGEGFKKVPEFAVYLLKKHGAQFKFDDCTIELSGHGTIHPKNLRTIWFGPLLKACQVKNVQREMGGTLPSLDALGPPPPFGTSPAFSAAQMMAQEKVRMRRMYAYSHLAEERRMRNQTTFELTSSFSGVIAPSAKEKIEEADKCFEETALITMANWQEKKIQTDPLIVSIYNGKAYLIDHFDTSQVENYVLSEFLL